MCLAVPGQLLSVDDGDALTRQGRVSFAGVVKVASLAYVPEARPGDYVLVHAGFAITVLDETEARRTLAYLADFVPEELP
ncbi:HypC/HybG/HupF family hydrogenase formation chaperone [Rhodanobacter ginsengisoli]|uniref:HypC/HybG/HupF family hydrogenase formation chaperone n=1 Tax=Rhodanobacter ginsengisoli TaxID=418646 RepID=A0ABW0QN75_9GAMM